MLAPHVAFTSSELRPTDPTSSFPNFAEDDLLSEVDSSHFRVHFSIEGQNAVPLVDNDASGVADYPEIVLRQYEEALTVYTALGLRPPVQDLFVLDGNGGSSAFDIYLVDFQGRADGQYRVDDCAQEEFRECAGHMLMENDFSGYAYPSLEVAARVVGSHELFHAIQASYTFGQSSLVSEGTAVWASEYFDPSLNDFEYFVGYLLERPQQSIYVQGAGILYAYSLGLFFKYLEEAFDAKIIMYLWEELALTANNEWVAALDRVLNKYYASSYEVAFEQFPVWNMYTSSRAKPEVYYVDGGGYRDVQSTKVTDSFYQGEPVRMFSSSARYWEVDLADVSEQKLLYQLVMSEEDAARAPDALSVWVTMVDSLGSASLAIEWMAGTSLDISGAEQVLVALINRRVDEPSLEVALCLSTMSGCPVEWPPEGDNDDGGSGSTDGLGETVGCQTAGSVPSGVGGTDIPRCFCRMYPHDRGSK